MTNFTVQSVEIQFQAEIPGTKVKFVQRVIKNRDRRGSDQKPLSRKKGFQEFGSWKCSEKATFRLKRSNNCE